MTSTTNDFYRDVDHKRVQRRLRIFLLSGGDFERISRRDDIERFIVLVFQYALFNSV